MIRFPWTFRSPSWTLPSPSACPCRTHASVPWSSPWLFVGLFPVCPCLSCTGKPRNGHKIQMWCHHWRVEGRVTFSDLLATPLLMHLWGFLTFFATIAHCWLMVSLLSTRIPHCPSLQICFIVAWFPESIDARGFSSPRCRTLHFPFLNFVRFLSAYFSILFRSCPLEWQHKSLVINHFS